MRDQEIDQILGYLEGRRRAMVDLLQRLALAESPSDDRAAVATVLAMLASELEECGMTVRRYRGRASGGMLFARPRERGQEQCRFRCSSDTATRSGRWERSARCRSGSRRRPCSGRASST